MSTISIAQPLTNPYIVLPGIARLWQALHDQAAALGQRTLQISIRSLADAANVSPGSVPRLLRQLVADGEIAYDPLTSTIVLAAINPSIDQSVDRPMATERTPAPSAENGDQSVDRPILSIEEEEDHEKRRQNTHQDGLEARLSQRTTTHPSVIDRILANPIGSLADFDADLARARRCPRIRNPWWFTISCWLNGRRVAAALETHHESRRASASSHRRYDRQSRGSRRAAQSVRPDAPAPVPAERVPSPDELPRINLAEFGLDIV